MLIANCKPINQPVYLELGLIEIPTRSGSMQMLALPRSKLSILISRLIEPPTEQDRRNKAGYWLGL
jgi:hypothetical protein